MEGSIKSSDPNILEARSDSLNHEMIWKEMACVWLTIAGIHKRLVPSETKSATILSNPFKPSDSGQTGENNWVLAPLF